MTQEPIYILGAGSIGCLWASALYKHKQPCHLLLSSKHRAKELEARGLTFESRINNETFNFTPEYSIANEVHQTIRYILVTTKAHQALNALLNIKQCIDDQTHIILLQNGMGSQQSIAKHFPNNSIYCAVTTEGAFTKQAFHVVHAGRGVSKIGCFQTSIATSQNTSQLINTLTTPYLSLEPIDNVEQALWQKLTINAAINAYTVIYQCKNGALLNNSEAIEHIKQCCEELAQLSHLYRLTLTAEGIFQQVSDVLKRTANNYSSMLQDVKNKSPTEIDFINGYVVNKAKEYQSCYIENQRLVNYIKNIEQKV